MMQIQSFLIQFLFIISLFVMMPVTVFTFIAVAVTGKIENPKKQFEEREPKPSLEEPPPWLIEQRKLLGDRLENENSEKVTAPNSMIREVETLKTTKKNNPGSNHNPGRGRPRKPVSLIKRGEQMFMLDGDKMVQVNLPSGYKVTKKTPEELTKELQEDDGLGPITIPEGETESE